MHLSQVETAWLIGFLTLVIVVVTVLSAVM